VTQSVPCHDLLAHCLFFLFAHGNLQKQAKAAQRRLMEFGDIDGDGKLTEDEKVRGFRKFKADASKRKAHFTQTSAPPSARSQRAPVKSTRPW